MADSKPKLLRGKPPINMIGYIDPESVHPGEYHDWAFELWAFQYKSQGMPSVARRIANPEEGDPLPARDIPVQSLYNWCYRQKWAEKLNQHLRGIAPEAHQQIVGDLLIASKMAAEYMVRIHADIEPLDTKEQQGKAKIKIEAAKVALDRSGFIPWISNSDKSRPAGPARSYEEAIGDADEQRLQAIINGSFQIIEQKALRPEKDE